MPISILPRLRTGPIPLATALASALDRTADLLLAEGRVSQAELLAERAAELREVAP